MLYSYGGEGPALFPSFYFLESCIQAVDGVGAGSSVFGILFVSFYYFYFNSSFPFIPISCFSCAFVDFYSFFSFDLYTIIH